LGTGAAKWISSWRMECDLRDSMVSTVISFALPDNADAVADLLHFRQDMRGKKNGASFFFRFVQ